MKSLGHKAYLKEHLLGQVRSWNSFIQTKSYLKPYLSRRGWNSAHCGRERQGPLASLAALKHLHGAHTTVWKAIFWSVPICQ